MDFKKLMGEFLKSQGTFKTNIIKKKTCLNDLFELVRQETLAMQNQNDDKAKMPLNILHPILESLIKCDLNNSLLKRLRAYLAYSDIRYFTLKYILTEFFANNKVNDLVISNLLNILSIMPGLVKESNKKQMPKISNDEAEEDFDDLESQELDQDIKHLNGSTNNSDEIKLFALKKDQLTANSKISQQNVHRKLFNDCFVNLLRYQLNAKLYKKVLIKLPDKILPKMSNPLMMADFLTQSYNSGGLISVLALNSLFILINNYNLEYPQFFQQVYKKLDASIFATKYKDRFFQLLDLFLTSTHLPSKLVAAFIKKLSRMCLTCPPGDLRFLILLVYNLLIRHKNCKILIHNTNKNMNNIADDPFDVNCLDYNLCNAFNSSLWEIKSLEKHYSPIVSKEVEKISNLSEVEYQLDDAFEGNSYEMLIDQELDANKATANCAINFLFKMNESNDKYYDSKISSILKIN